MAHWQISIDTGGTFTDCLAQDPTGKLHRTKVPSSGHLRGTLTQAQGNTALVKQSWGAPLSIFKGYTFTLSHLNFTAQVLQGKDQQLVLSKNLPFAAQGDFNLSAQEEAPLLAARLITGTGLQQPFPPIQMRLGTTKGTNALLEHAGKAPLLVITKGFADLPLIGNQQRRQLFALNFERPRPYHAQVFEVNERINAAGEVEKALNPNEIKKLQEYCRQNQVQNAAVVTLNSYKNPQHEQAIAQALADVGLPYVTTSAALSPQINFQQRCDTAVVNAYLRPVLDQYLEAIGQEMKDLKIMSSAGGLISKHHFHPKDSLFSGPAGGVVAAEKMAQQTGQTNIITFDMGGTSTDVARYSGRFDYAYQSQIGHAQINAPALNLHTVAAGGGSICQFDGEKFTVGPESGGAQPGPACYGAGGPLCLTDVNLLLGKMATDEFSIPLQRKAAEEQLQKMLEQQENPAQAEEILQGFLNIANEKMADAVRQISTARGYNPAEHALLAFGGAGGMHVCAVASLLGIKKVILPKDAGILSAYGISQALEERFASQEVLHPLKEVKNLESLIRSLKQEALQDLEKSGYQPNELEVRHAFCYLRFKGQEHALEIDYQKNSRLTEAFEEEYRALYGHYMADTALELVSLKIVASPKAAPAEKTTIPDKQHAAKVRRTQGTWINNRWQKVPVYAFKELKTGAVLKGPGLILYPTSTAFLESGWQAVLTKQGSLLAQEKSAEKQNQTQPEAVQLELFSNRFTAVAREMGALLQRTAFSVNIKERLDFSCALLDADGDLIVNAPHIPVHLGALGVCTKALCKALPLGEGDVAITNSPAYGGSHLPDITLIAPIHFKGHLVGYAANRAHHAELGGIAPGSMPANAKNLAQEGVVIKPLKIVEAGQLRWPALKEILTQGPFPTRNLAENQADLNASLASIEKGKKQLIKLFEKEGMPTVQHYMRKLKNYAHKSLWKALGKMEKGTYQAEEFLDDGSPLRVKILLTQKTLHFDFSGTAPTHARNLNANPAIVTSVVLYVLRLLADEDVPLNEGMLQAVTLNIPQGTLLNPVFTDNPENCPAVVGGNVELSQRLTDTLLKAFKLAACSHGSMNNVLFGNQHFGFYETIGGGVGATPNLQGASAVHQHMTNTRITDAEIMEFRYPVQVRRFAIRKNSGGAGQLCGGHGIVRELYFKEAVTLTVLTQHRQQGPYGMAGGQPGKPGKQFLLKATGQSQALKHVETVNLSAGDSFVIETPGGGGYGPANS
jgi:5-oxoprolinase (ATP-hydrolysing)